MVLPASEIGHAAEVIDLNRWDVAEARRQARFCDFRANELDGEDDDTAAALRRLARAYRKRAAEVAARAPRTVPADSGRQDGPPDAA